jgi:hypothetical protein
MVSGESVFQCQIAMAPFHLLTKFARIKSTLRPALKRTFSADCVLMQ